MNKFKFLLLGAAMVNTTAASAAATIWVDDAYGRIGKVEASTGNATLMGPSDVLLTDIAFDPDNNLYGISFSTLYSINQATGKVTFIGNLTGVNDANSLVFGKDGSLYSAGYASKNLYKIDPKTGASTVLFNTGYSSGGDLAFIGSDLYYTDGQNLILLNLSTKVSKLIGPIGASYVYGLINGGDDMLYAMAGNSVYSVNITTGKGTLLSTWPAATLGQAYGSTVMGEASSPFEAKGHDGQDNWREVTVPTVSPDPIKQSKANSKQR